MEYGTSSIENNAITGNSAFLHIWLRLKYIIVIALPLIFDIDGIWWATVIAEVMALLVSVHYLVKMKKRYGY